VLTYKVAGVREDVEQRWTQYTASLLAVSVFGFLLVYLLQRAQAYLPFNPQNFGTPNVTPDLAFNTAASFTSNTNWQSYVPEQTMSYLTQMVALTVQNFVLAAVGMAILVAFIRGLVRRSAQTIGNFWVDLTRTTLYILLPLYIMLALLLVWSSLAVAIAQIVARTSSTLVTPGGARQPHLFELAGREGLTLPASLGGPAHVKALCTVFPEVSFCPTGGIDERNEIELWQRGAMSRHLLVHVIAQEALAEVLGDSYAVGRCHSVGRRRRQQVHQVQAIRSATAAQPVGLLQGQVRHDERHHPGGGRGDADALGAVAAGQDRARRRDDADDPDVEVRVGQQLQLRLHQLEPLGLHGHRLALEQADHGVHRLLQAVAHRLEHQRMIGQRHVVASRAGRAERAQETVAQGFGVGRALGGDAPQPLQSGMDRTPAVFDQAVASPKFQLNE